MAKGMRPRGIGNRAGADAAGLRLHPEPRSKGRGDGLWMSTLGALPIFNHPACPSKIFYHLVPHPNNTL